MTEHVTTFGKALKAERERKELTQSQLAERLGTTQQNIGHWEAGRSLPKQETHERLLEVFGPDSVLSYMAPKGEIRVERTPRAAPDVPINMVQFQSALRARQVESESRLRESLPTHLREYLDQPVQSPARFPNKGLNYVVDYLSPKLCVEILRVNGRRMLLTARLGIQRLLVLRKLIELRGDARPERYVLLLVLDELSSLQGSDMSKQESESGLLGVEISYCNRVEAAAQTIEALESGAVEEDDLDTGDYV